MVDERYIVFVNEAVKLVESSKADSFISSELWKQSEYIIYTLFKLGVYNEAKDNVEVISLIIVS